MNQELRSVVAFVISCAMALLAACAVTESTAPAAQLDPTAKWVLLPFANNTETPLAGNRAEAITESLLRARGVTNLTRYPASLAQEALFDSAQGRAAEQAMGWAKEQGARYAVTGAVDEWRYKVGVDGEPAVGVMLQIVDLSNGAVVWSGVGGKTGWAREGLAAVAQKLIRNLLAPALRPK